MSADRLLQRYAERDASPALSGFWRLSNPVALALAQQRERAVLGLLGEAGLDLGEQRLLDLGCGTGMEFAQYLRWGARRAHWIGVDLIGARLQQAQANWGGGVAQASGAALPFADASFDFVVQNVVFSSIVEVELRRRVAAELLRVLSPGGHLLWYDMARAHPHDPHLRDVSEHELRALFPGLRWTLRRLTPHLGLLKRVERLAGWPGMQLLMASGLWRTHLLGLGRKP